ncbi:MAG: hypothetical protein JKY70_18900 [Mucilaginibacter sp.]|nr:hypothetical protein [Mucilaginibacter sp.]
MKNLMLRVALPCILLSILATLNGCKKESQLSPSIDQNVNDSVLLATSPTAVLNVVSTIAGIPNSPGFTNGLAKTAQFNGPGSLQLTKDGSIYMVDTRNNAIRKLSADGNVSTLVLKTPPYYDLQSPSSVGVDDAGNIFVLSRIVDQAGQTYVFDPKGNFVAGYENTYTALGALAKDPYEDFFWFTSHNSIRKYIVNADGSIGRDNVPYDENILTEDETRRGQTFTGLFVGRNRIIYFSIGSRLFEYTPKGTTLQLYPNLNLGSISAIVLNADSRSMYLAADGKIERIENGKLTVLAGPNSSTPDGRDGTGLKADVHASSLALGDHENSLYFSDYSTNTIRKLKLK